MSSEQTIEIPSDWGTAPTSPNPTRSISSTPLFLSEFDPLETSPPPPSQSPPPPPPSSSKPPKQSSPTLPPKPTSNVDIFRDEQQYQPRGGNSGGDGLAGGGVLNSIAATFKRRSKVEGGRGSATGSEGESSDTGRAGGAAGGGSKQAQQPAFDFPRFLEQLKSRSAEPVAKYLKSFLTNFAKKTFSMNEMIKLVHDFLKFIAARMKECEPWKSQSEGDFDNSLDCMEKLVMNRLYPFTFTPKISLNPSSPITTDDLERDAVLRQRIRLFGWIEGKHLDVIDHDPEDDGEDRSNEKKTDEEGGEIVERGAVAASSSGETRRGLSRDDEGGGVKGFLEFAGSELLKVNHFKAPRDKLICILNCCKVIFGLIRHLAKGKHGQSGADAFIPILIFVVLKSNPEHLISNVEYINRFRSATKLQSEAGYYLSSLMGSITFIEAMDHSSLSNITKEEFDAQVSRSIALLPPPTPPTHSPAPSSTTSLQPFSHTDSGEEPALPITSAATASLRNIENFFVRTGDSISRPLNAIGKIFTDALDGPLDPPPSRDSLAADGGAVPYEARRRSPRPRSFVGLPPTDGRGDQPPGFWRGDSYQQQQLPPLTQWRETLETGGNARGDEEEEEIVDYEQLQMELDRRDELSRQASLQTLSQIFPNLDADLASLILDSKQGDLPGSIDALLEMGST